MSAEDVISVGPHTYRVEGRLNAMEQFHISRRLGPALIICGVTFREMMSGAHVPLEHWLAVAGPVMEVVSRMSDEDVEYVILTSLKVCRRQQNAAWAPVVTPDGKTLMFADMDQADLLQLTVEVLRRNLQNFMRGLGDGGTTSTDSAPASPRDSSRSA